MAKVLKVFRHGGIVASDYVYKDLGSPPASFWMEARVAIPSGQENPSGGPSIIEFGDGLYLDYSGGGWRWNDECGSGTPSGEVPTYDAWMLVKAHYDGTDITWWVDGSLVETYTEGCGLYSEFDFGQLGGPHDQDIIIYFDDVKIGTTEGASDLFSDDFEGGDLSAWDGSSGDVSVVDDPGFSGGGDDDDIGVNNPLASYRWRFVVTRLSSGRILTYLDHLARQKRATYTLNKAAVATGVVPSDNQEVNIVQADDLPALSEGVRGLLGFRQEGGDPRWVIRYAGIILQVEDNVDENAGAAPYTTFTAYDPWQLLYYRPVRDADGNLPGTDGLTYSATPGSEIVTDLLSRTFDAEGEHHIAISGGTIETTATQDITFQQGTSVGEALDQLVASGFIDIVLTALYDPLVRPEKLVTLNIYQAPVGSVRHKAVMAWDKPSRSLVGLNRLKDGTRRANRIQYYRSDGTPAGLETDFASIAKYGEYWSQQNFPGEASTDAVEALAAEQLLVRKEGETTFKVTPVPGSLGQIDSPIFFLDYKLGDQVPVFASDRFREEIAVADETSPRIYEVPIDIRDDGQETISELTFSADGAGE